VVGLTFVDVLEMFRKDPQTSAIAMIGEIGGNAEERAAEYLIETNYPKPVAAYIAGRAAPSGKRMGHAGAIIMGKTGTAETKINALREAGVKIALKPSEIAGHLKL
jgi:succinyl-CoA synthetase alpha subunit